MSKSAQTLRSLVALCAILAVPVALADSYKRMTHEIDASSFDTLQLEMSVGEMDIEFYDGDVIELDIQLEADRSWLTFRRRSVDNVELEQLPSGSRLYLGIDRDNIEQTWKARIPAKLALEIEVGVGDVGIEGLENDLNLDVGVGAAKVEVPTENYHTVAVTAGVGDAMIRGFSGGADNERHALVGANAYYNGDGEYEIRIEVGVGDAQVRKR